MHTFTADELGSAVGIVMEISCHISGICVPALSSSFFSVISSWYSKLPQSMFVAKNECP